MSSDTQDLHACGISNSFISIPLFWASSGCTCHACIMIINIIVTCSDFFYKSPCTIVVDSRSHSVYWRFQTEFGEGSENQKNSSSYISIIIQIWCFWRSLFYLLLVCTWPMAYVVPVLMQIFVFVMMVLTVLSSRKLSS